MKRNEFAQNKPTASNGPKIEVSQVWHSDGVKDFGFGKGKCSIQIIYFNPFTEKWGARITDFSLKGGNSAIFRASVLCMSETEIHNHFEVETKQLSDKRRSYERQETELDDEEEDDIPF